MDTGPDYFYSITVENVHTAVHAKKSQATSLVETNVKDITSLKPSLYYKHITQSLHNLTTRSSTTVTQSVTLVFMTSPSSQVSIYTSSFPHTYCTNPLKWEGNWDCLILLYQKQEGHVFLCNL